MRLKKRHTLDFVPGMALLFVAGSALGQSVPMPCWTGNWLTERITQGPVYHERELGFGITGTGAIARVFIDPEEGTWTVLVQLPTGAQCLVLSGTEWQLPMEGEIDGTAEDY